MFDKIYHSFPKAKEGRTLGARPKSTLSWRKETKKSYVAKGPRGGEIRIRYNERSNKVTISRGVVS